MSLSTSTTLPQTSPHGNTGENTPVGLSPLAAKLNSLKQSVQRPQPDDISAVLSNLERFDAQSYKDSQTPFIPGVEPVTGLNTSFAELPELGPVSFDLPQSLPTATGVNNPIETDLSFIPDSDLNKVDTEFQINAVVPEPHVDSNLEEELTPQLGNTGNQVKLTSSENTYTAFADEENTPQGFKKEAKNDESLVPAARSYKDLSLHFRPNSIVTAERAAALMARRGVKISA